MKVYIAAMYSRRFELREVDQALRDAGHEPTSQWVWNAEESKGQREAAEMDVEDVRRADAILFFGQPPRSMNSGGGRWFELGLAWAEGKKIFAVLSGGGTETIFLHLPGVLRFERVEHAIKAISMTGEADDVVVKLKDWAFVPEEGLYQRRDPADVQAKVLELRDNNYFFQLSDWEQDVVRDAAEAGRATVGWDLDTYLGRVAAVMRLEGMKRVRQV